MKVNTAKCSIIAVRSDSRKRVEDIEIEIKINGEEILVLDSFSSYKYLGYFQNI
jgi:hypothetical protein